MNRLAAGVSCRAAFSPIAVAREDCALGTVQQTPSGARTQGIRIPNSALSLRVLKRPVRWPHRARTVPAAKSAQTVEEAEAALGDAVDLYLDGGPTQGHVSSTVVAADPLARDGIAILTLR